MIDLSKEIDFSKEIREDSQLKEFLKQASDEISSGITADQIKKPFLDTQFNSWIVVTGLPKTTSDKIEKLSTVLEKYLEKLGLKDTYEALFHGFTDSTNTNSSGAALIDFINPENALNAVQKLNLLAFDKNHTLNAVTFANYDKIIKTSSDYHPPNILRKEDLKSWLLDPHLLDQYVVRTQQKIMVSWFNHLEKKPANALSSNYLELKDGRVVTKIDWSKNGTYLIVCCQNDFHIFGGTQFQHISSFEHMALKKVETSPNEKYILSFNGTVVDSPNTENYIVWNLETTEKLRVFKADAMDMWGAMKWSPDSKYIAKSSEDLISLYELPSMTLAKNTDGSKCFIRIPNIRNFSWIENSNVLLCASFDNQKKEASAQSKILLLEIPFNPTKVETKKWKSINWEITNCEIIVSKNGDWVCLVMKKKGKKGGGNTFLHVANLKKKTLEIADIEFQEKVRSFNFDTKNGRFAFVFEDQAPKDAGGHVKYDSVFFGIETEPTKIKEYGRIAKGKTSEVLFSANGAFFAIVNKDQSSPSQGNIDFGYLKPNEKFFVPEVTKSVLMSYMSSACWDPSGRFLITGSSQTKTFIIFNAYGEQLYKDTFTTDLSQIIWRNRPRNLLDNEKEAAIQANFKQYKLKYEESDDRIINKLKYEREQKRNEMKKNFLSFLDQKRKEYDQSKKERVDLKGFDSDDMSDVTMDEFIEYEHIIETKPTGGL